LIFKKKLKGISSEVGFTRSKELDDLAFSAGCRNKFYLQTAKKNRCSPLTSKTQMEIESPHILSNRTKLFEIKKVSNSTGQTKKRKLSNLNFQFNYLDQNFLDLSQECCTPKLEVKQPRSRLFGQLSTGSHKFGRSIPIHHLYESFSDVKIDSKRVLDDFCVLEVKY